MRNEAFCFAAINFIDLLDKPITSEEDRFAYLAEALSNDVKIR